MAQQLLALAVATNQQGVNVSLTRRQVRRAQAAYTGNCFVHQRRCVPFCVRMFGHFATVDQWWPARLTDTTAQRWRHSIGSGMASRCCTGAICDLKRLASTG